jgi:membrane-associated protein
MFGLDLIAFLKVAGYTGLGGIVFAESGLLIGFFLPGDSLLFTAGFLASQGVFHVIPLIIISFVCAVAGDSVGYSFGLRIGRRIFNREDSILFNKSHLLSAEEFYKKHGKKTIILARFLPVIRTFAPIVAGVGRMHYPTFLAYNLIGGIAWGIGLPLAGYYLGSAIPDIDRYLIPIIIGIIVLSFLPTIIHLIRNREDRERLFGIGKQLLAKVFKPKS